MTQKRNLNVVNVLANTFKFATKATLVMLCVVFLTSCSDEIINSHPTSASKLMVSEFDSTMVLGHTKVWWSGEATTADGQHIDGSGNIEYRCLPKVYVDVLGLPTDVTPNADGTFSSSDGNLFNRSFIWNSTTGVQGSSTPTWERTVILAQLNDSTELCEAQFNEDWAAWTNKLPSSIESSQQGKELVRVLYQRVIKVQAQYRQRAERINGGKGKVYYDLFLEKSTDGGRTWESVKKYEAFLACMYGQWKPNVVNTLAVSSFDFVTKDEVVEMQKDEPTSADGWERKNVISREYRWGDQFQAPADAEGSTTRLIGGAQIYKVWTASCTNPETGETVVFSFDGEITSTHSVDENGLYSRTVSINLNGEVIETQPGSVQLMIAN